jgi:hypothetical protein
VGSDPGIGIGHAGGNAFHVQVVVVGMADTAANDRGGGEHAGVVQRNLPRAVAAHRQAGEVEPPAVAMVCLDAVVERLQGHLLDLAIPGGIVRCLRDHHHGMEVPAMLLEPWRQALAELAVVVAAALAAAVQEQHHRPRAFGRPAVRYEHLVVPGLAMQLQRALVEGRRFASVAGDAGDHQAKQQDEAAHGDIPWRCFGS